VLRTFALTLGLAALMLQALAPLCLAGTASAGSGQSIVICTVHGMPDHSARCRRQCRSAVARSAEFHVFDMFGRTDGARIHDTDNGFGSCSDEFRSC
jgi:hypothetical protein